MTPPAWWIEKHLATTRAMMKRGGGRYRKQKYDPGPQPINATMRAALQRQRQREKVRP